MVRPSPLTSFSLHSSLIVSAVRTDLFEKYGGALDGGFSVLSNDSSYTLELQQTHDPTALWRDPAQRAGNWREQLQRDYLVTRGVDTAGTATARRKAKEKEKELKRNSIQLRPLARSAVHYPVPTKREEEERKELLAALVMERAKADGIRDLIGQCYNCAAVGPWSKQRRRSVGLHPRHSSPPLFSSPL
jgi:hypothetical protein